jgi:hypothetical protein
MAIHFQRIAQGFDEQGIVIHHENAETALAREGVGGRGFDATAGAAGTGKTNRIVVPFPTALSISISALWRRAMP